jgi:hypothetical protein
MVMHEAKVLNSLCILEEERKKSEKPNFGA